MLQDHNTHRSAHQQTGFSLLKTHKPQGIKPVAICVYAPSTSSTPQTNSSPNSQKNTKETDFYKQPPTSKESDGHTDADASSAHHANDNPSKPPVPHPHPDILGHLGGTAACEHKGLHFFHNHSHMQEQAQVSDSAFLHADDEALEATSPPSNAWQLTTTQSTVDRHTQHEGIVQDLALPVPVDARWEWVDRASVQGLDIIRHTAAHVLAQAVQELYPETQVTIGPVIEDGFYYDFYRPQPFSVEDLAVIQQRMQDIVARNLPIVRHVWSREEALAFFGQRGEQFKQEIIAAIPADQPLSVYQQGDFYDLCRGPHLPNTGTLGKHFALQKVSAAYWRADSTKASLQRIYGTAWATADDLQAYLNRLEQARARDHRRLGQQMDLFHTQEEAPGSIFWHPAGWTLYQSLRTYLTRRLKKQGYVEVNTPQLVSKTLWEASGHWQKFRNNMYVVSTPEHTFALKPMNCPCHVQIFNHSLKSYRDLPLRMAEFGSCMRHEASGSRSGIMRVANFVQDDAHIFCTPQQMIQETADFCRLLFSVYADLGFQDVSVRFSTRPAERLGDETLWDQAEQALQEGAQAAGLTYTLNPGEGAFYGPKLEFTLKDCLGRLWQCGTLQVDFVLPQRLNAYYIGPDGHKHHPVMLHRAILGSFERFIGVLLEHSGGRVPLWLAPTQAVVLPITDKTQTYASAIHQALNQHDLRTHYDDRAEKLGFKVREHTLAKVPFIVVVGEKEEENGTLVIRTQAGQETYGYDEGIAWLAAHCQPPA